MSLYSNRHSYGDFHSLNKVFVIWSLLNTDLVSSWSVSMQAKATWIQREQQILSIPDSQPIPTQISCRTSLENPLYPLMLKFPLRFAALTLSLHLTHLCAICKSATSAWVAECWGQQPCLKNMRLNLEDLCPRDAGHTLHLLSLFPPLHSSPAHTNSCARFNRTYPFRPPPSLAYTDNSWPQHEKMACFLTE